ncbi:MAG: bifunctional diguanylate cyclase/phosphodiesterase, partial [Dermatophilaceae bacterium]
MTVAEPAPDPEAPTLADPAWSQGVARLRLQASDERLAVRSRAASVVLVLVLLAVSVFAVWTSQATSYAASRAVAASHLSDHFAEAATAVAAEESWERKYRLEPRPENRTGYNAAAADLVSALGWVRRDGVTSDRVLVDAVLAQHRIYLTAIDHLFAAVDRGDTTTVLRVDGTEVDPFASRIRKSVGEAASREHQIALAELAHLQQLETLTSGITPVVFLVGLALAALLVSITRGHRRLLDVERARAVHDSLHDALTGLPNRSLLADRFGQALRVDGRLGTRTGLLLIDLDRFKDVNDTFGHHYGDELLTQVGNRLVGELRAPDTVARLGGDEFAVLLPNVGGLDNATAIATSLRACLEKPFHVEGIDLDVEASVGVVLSGNHGGDTTTLMQRADIAMYVAKTQTLGVFAYEPGADGHSPTKLALLGDLRRALERGELILHYQPQVDIGTGDVVGVEGLIRWQHPQRGLVMPDEFIPLAEHTGLIGPLTRHVLDVALAQARVWSDAGRPLTVSVNLSVRNLLDEALPGQVTALLGAHGVAPELLKLEVTETAIMTEPARAQRLLTELSALGIRISIDDFGAGYTSLGQLKNLPVNELKIDRSFVITMTEDPSNALIVRSVVDLGHNLGFGLVAEGVESEQTLTALAAVGCDVAQGYHL